MLGAEMVGRLMTAATHGWAPGCGGGERMTFADAAGACRGLSDWEFAAVIYVYGQENSVGDMATLYDDARHKVFAYVMERTVDMAVRERWNAPKGRMTKFVRMAMADVRGGFSYANGSGDAERARIACVSKTRWSRVWGARYRSVRAELDSLLASAQCWIKSQR